MAELDRTYTVVEENNVFSPNFLLTYLDCLEPVENHSKGGGVAIISCKLSRKFHL